MPRRPPPQHQPYHVIANVQPPIYAAKGISPWRLSAPRPDGTVFNTVQHVVVNDETTVKDLIGQQLHAADGTPVIPNPLQWVAWPPGHPMPPTVVIEADCNRGKSHAVHRGMIRRLLLHNPLLPMLHVSVRVTHALDLYETVQKHYVTNTGQPIPGVNMVLYKEGGDEGVKKRCREATQLVISPEQIALGHLGDISRFRGGVLVLDEAFSFALSLGKGSHGTISNPQRVVDTLQELTRIVPHVIVMDRDMTLNPVGSKLLPCVAPDRDVVHVQLTRPGQRSALCYTFHTRKHADAGRGMPLALKRLMLQLHQCQQSFANTADDHSAKGPSEWRRMLIALTTKKTGEKEIVPLLKQMGFTPNQYLFVHGDSSEVLKAALRDTNELLRNVIVLIATTTIEVAINIEHNFHSRWLFTSRHGQFVSLSSELMQLLARLPRGVDAARRDEQLTDHRIYVVFDGDHPSVAQPGEVRSSDDVRHAALKRGFEQRNEALLEEEQRAVAARLALEAVSSAEPAPRGGDVLNTLRAAVDDYRAHHVGQQHVQRYFEIAAKNGFETPEEMAVLTAEELAALTTIQHGLQGAEAVMAAEAAILFQGTDDEVDKYVNDHPTDAEKRFDVFTRYLDHRLMQENLQPIEPLTAQDLHESFLMNCFGLHPRDPMRTYSALDKLMLNVFFNLRSFILDSDPDRSTLVWIEDRAEALSTPPGVVYAAIVGLKPGAQRLARLRLLSLAQIRRDDQEKREGAHAKHREVEALDGVWASKLHELFGLLQNFQALEPTEVDGAPLGWLVHGAGMEDGTLVPGSEGCPWLEAHNRLVRKVWDNVEQQRQDEQLCMRVKALVETLPGVNRGQWKQASLLKAFQRALELLGLHCVVEVREVRGKKLAASVEVHEMSIDHAKFGCSLADTVRMYVPGNGDQRYVRADLYAETMRRARNQRRVQRRDQGWSDSEAGSPDRPVLPTPMAVDVPLPFDPLRRREAVDAHKLRVTLIDALDDKDPRDAALAAIDERISKLQGRPASPLITAELQQLDVWRKALAKMADLQAMLSAIDSHFGEEETEMKRWMSVPYEKASLGRTYARAQAVAMTLFDGADEPMQRQKMRSLGYQGMHTELRTVLGGRFLHDLDMKKAFATLVVNIARRKGWLQMIPRIDDYAAHGEAWLRRIVAHHNLSARMDADSASGAAKLLVNGKMNMMGYRTWLAEHGMPLNSVGEPGVVALGDEVIAFRDRIFADPEFKPRIDQEREALCRDHPGQNAARVERSLWARWLQEQDNAVLMLMDTKLRRMGLTVTALVFDGCMVEAPEGVDINHVLHQVELWLRDEHDWHIRLAEKPLYGLQDTPPPSFALARAAMTAARAALGM